MREEKRLLPCPACGSENLCIRCNPIHKNWNAMSAIACSDCYMQGPPVVEDEAAIKAWNALPRTLSWTQEPPTKPGWYWARFSDKTGKPRLLEIQEYNLKTAQRITEWEWAGPIPQPREK